MKLKVVRHQSGFYRASLIFPKWIRDKHGLHKFGAFGETVPLAVFNAAKHALEQTQGASK